MRMHISLLSIIIIGLAAGIATPTQAGVITLTTNDGAGAGADAHIRGGVNANTAFGTDPDLRVRNSTLNNSRKTYLRFDLSTLLIPAMDVELQITFTNDFTVVNGLTFQVYGLNDSLNADGWVENTMTWNSAPQNDTTSPNGFLAGATLLGTSFFPVGYSFVDGDTISFSYASMVNFINADTDNRVTFMLASQNTNANTYTFASNNNLGAYPNPTLVITTVPEPSTFALLGFGLVGLVGFARRRKK